MAAKKCFAVVLMDENVQQVGTLLVIGDKKNVVSSLYLERASAIAKAEEMAGMHPKKPVVLLESTLVFEAKKPETTTKEFTLNGELVPSKAG